MATKSPGVPSPEEQQLTEARARWLAKETGISVKKLVNRQIGEVHELIRPVIDPHLLFFRKICGRVVKRDPLTGEDFGVPNATVHVEDIDLSLLSYYPRGIRYWWAWPFNATREQIGQVRTDSCGHFCVWIPRWDIDRILRLRRKMVCEPLPPNITEVLHRIYEEIEWPQRPIPDPGPLRDLPADILPRIRDELGAPVAEQLARLIQPDAFPGHEPLAELLAQPAFAAAPPAPPLERGAPRKLSKLDHPALGEAKRLGLEAFDFESFVGPFFRCREQLVLEWQTVVDIPDITFTVTQDVDGDGDEEVIYSESFFDVRWDAGPIPDVTLHASASALSTPFCGGSGEARECESKAELYAVGTMPLDPEYHDPASGYALRVNRARTGGLPSGAPIDPAHAPYARQLALQGCHRLPGATHQRVMYRTEGTNPVPLFVPTWYAPTRPGQPTPVVPFTQDAEGWIEIRPAEALAFPDWVLHWPTPLGGRYFLHLECGDGSGNLVGSPSDEVGFKVDNAGCQLSFGAIKWRPVGAGSWTTLPDECPVIRRPAGAAIELVVPWSADSVHFRNARLDFAGCGGSSSATIGADTEPITYEQWHDSVLDTHGGDVAYYTVADWQPEGAYTLSLSAWTRAWQPGFDAGPPADFYFDPSWVWSYLPRAIAIVNA